MYHSNQILDVTCEPKDLDQVIAFAVGLYTENAHLFTRLDGRMKMAWSEPVPGAYALGTGSMKPYEAGPNKGYGHGAPEGWTDYPFDYDPEIVSKITAQWLEKNPPKDAERPLIDGSTHPGFRAMSLRSAEAAGILPAYGVPGWCHWDAILVLVPCWLEYHK